MTKSIIASDGVRLAVYERGDPARPTLVAVHGYPDDHTVWDGLADLLADRFHVVTYDVRGAGASGRPAANSAYRIPQLVDDLAAVLDAVSPDAPVHLLGHDWGSIQCWAALSESRLAGRITTYTSISGPALEYGAAWLRGLRAHPRAGARQLAHSYYLLLFLVPGLPEFAMRRGWLERLSHHRAALPDQLAGLSLYRANLRRVRRPRPVPDDVRVQVIVPDRDPFVTAPFAAESPRPWVTDLSVQPIAGGHWVVSRDPASISELVAQLAS